MQKYPQHVRRGNWNLMDLSHQKDAGDRYREESRATEHDVEVRARVSRVLGMATSLFHALNESDLTSDDRTAARQLFNVLYDRLGDK